MNSQSHQSGMYRVYSIWLILISCLCSGFTQALSSIKWHLAKLEESYQGTEGNDLVKLVSVAREVGENVSRVASVIHGNSRLLFITNNNNSSTTATSSTGEDTTPAGIMAGFSNEIYIIYLFGFSDEINICPRKSLIGRDVNSSGGICEWMGLLYSVQ